MYIHTFVYAYGVYKIVLEELKDISFIFKIFFKP